MDLQAKIENMISKDKLRKTGFNLFDLIATIVGAVPVLIILLMK